MTVVDMHWIRERARSLRRSQTDAERRLWAHLRARQLHGAKFRRQQPIGIYIVDFCCPEHRLIVELDGGQHALTVAADQARTEYLERHGYRVLRFWDNDVLTHLHMVVERILQEITSRPLAPPLSP
jgi:very-short-patch-repair endonuclease